MNKAATPSKKDLKEKLGPTYKAYNTLKKHLNDILISPAEEWNFPGTKYGWSFRMKSKKRNIIYFLPRAGYFKVAFVFGAKAYDKVLEGDVKESIRKELSKARIYAEGRESEFDIHEENALSDIKTLMQIKVDN